MRVKRVLAILASAAFLLSGFSPALAANVSGLASAGVSSDSAVGSSVSLPVLVITETAPGDIPVGTLTWTLPSGFVFDSSSVANVAFAGAGLTGSSIVSFSGTNQFSVTVNSSSTAAGSLTVGSVTPLKVKAASGSSMAAAGNIMLTSGSITGISSGASFGLLMQVAGSPVKLAFTIQPPANVLVGANFSASVGIEDQFSHVVTTDNARNITVSAVLASGTVGSLSGTAIRSDASGMASFNDLSFSGAGQIQLNASSTGLTGALSSMVMLTVNPPTTTPPSVPCGLRNGMLVKVAGSPTVYMVVNCVLRPFNSAAIFHARGKKFSDIVIINGLFNLGRPIGEGNDDDDTIITITPPNASSTVPTISGLPDGSIVKLPGNPTVYMVSGGVLQPFTSLIIFRARHKNFKDVVTISASQFASLTVGPPVNFPDGTLVKGSDNTVFVVQGGQLLGIPSLESLRHHGWSLSNVLKVNNGDLNGLGHGGDED